jgi:hypothetical protein
LATKLIMKSDGRFRRYPLPGVIARAFSDHPLFRSPDDERPPSRVGDPHASDNNRSRIEISGLPLSDDKSVAHQAAQHLDWEAVGQ